LQVRSANRAALDVVHAAAVAAGATLDVYDALERVPPLNPDAADDPGDVVTDWRGRIAQADVVVIASPEYAGSLAGVVKNALDWIVGSGELYSKPVGLISAGTSGGHHARQALVQTLTWQGAHVVASVGIDAPRTKSDGDGTFTDPATIVELEAFASLMLAVARPGGDTRLALVCTIVADAGVDANHIAPVV
jgi:Predicted flavoprotein